MADLPYSQPSRQVQGRITERRIAKERGWRAHPNSGAGHIKHDASDDNTLVEIKDANINYSMKGRELKELWTRAIRQGKEPLFIVTFANGVTAECKIDWTP